MIVREYKKTREKIMTIWSNVNNLFIFQNIILFFKI